MNSGTTDNGMRTKALVGLGVAMLLSIAGWFWLSRAAQAGLERIGAIERARAECERLWSAATTRADSLSVDRIALKDTIDARSEGAMSRCGDMRSTTTQPNPREMNGAPMPRGLR